MAKLVNMMNGIATKVKIVRTTKTMIVVEYNGLQEKYNKKTGKPVGYDNFMLLIQE